MLHLVRFLKNLQTTQVLFLDKKPRGVVLHPVLVPQALHLGDVISKTILCSSVQQRKKTLLQVQQTAALQNEWKKHSRYYM